MFIVLRIKKQIYTTLHVGNYIGVVTTTTVSTKLSFVQYKINDKKRQTHQNIGKIISRGIDSTMIRDKS